MPDYAQFRRHISAGFASSPSFSPSSLLFFGFSFRFIFDFDIFAASTYFFLSARFDTAAATLMPPDYCFRRHYATPDMMMLFFFLHFSPRHYDYVTLIFTPSRLFRCRLLRCCHFRASRLRRHDLMPPFFAAFAMILRRRYYDFSLSPSR